MKQRIIYLCLLALFGTTVARADLLLTHAGTATIAAPYSGPGDILTFLAWYGLRPYSAATVGNKAVSLIRASDSHTCDALSSSTTGLGKTANCSTGGDNNTVLATWCNATTCSVQTFYDQTAGGNCSGTCDAVQATGSRQPTISFSCTGSFPCMAFARASTQFLASANSISGDTSIIGVTAMRTGSTTATNNLLSPTHEQTDATSAGNQWEFGSGPTLTRTANDSAWHVGSGTCNSTSSIFNVDGSSTTGTAGCSSVGSGVNVGSFNKATTATLAGDFLEGGIINSVRTNTDMNNICTNVSNFYSFGLTC